jgi:hypothetical protein
MGSNKQTVDNSLGSITFKLVGQVDPVDLKEADGMRVFSGLLKGVMAATQQPVIAA